MRSRLLLVAALLAAGCAGPERTTAEATQNASTALAFPSELPTDAALGLTRNTLRRAGWPVPRGPLAEALVTGWRATDAGRLRLHAVATDAHGGASTVVSVWGEREVDGAAVPVVAADGGAAWRLVEAAAKRVGAEVRYARP